MKYYYLPLSGGMGGGGGGGFGPQSIRCVRVMIKIFYLIFNYAGVTLQFFNNCQVISITTTCACLTKIGTVVCSLKLLTTEISEVYGLIV